MTSKEAWEIHDSALHDYYCVWHGLWCSPLRVDFYYGHGIWTQVYDVWTGIEPRKYVSPYSELPRLE